MYSFQGKLYSSLAAVPSEVIAPFIGQTALTETVRYQNESLLFWEEHYFRLMAAMRILRMEIPLQFTMEYLQDAIIDLLNATQEKERILDVEINVVRANIPHKSSPLAATRFSISSLPKKQPFSHRQAQKPIDLYKDHYITSGLYSSLESAHQQWRNMAWVYVHENQFCDGIILNQEKAIAESLVGALFLIKENQVSTPALSQGCRKSVYRSQLIAVIQQMDDLEITEEIISPFVLQKADEMFVLNGVSGLISIPKYRKKEFASSQTQRIAAAFSEKITTRL